MIDEKTMVADTLAGINGELTRFGEMIPQTENKQLKQTLNELMKINENNKLLTKESLDMVEFELNIAKNAVLTPQTGNYSKNAYDEERIQTVSGFDARQ